MPADLHLRIRDADTWDAATTADALTCSIAATSVARWLLPNTDARTRHLKLRLAAVVAEHITAGTLRLADDDGQIIGATMWTSCPTTDYAAADPHAVLMASGADANRSRLLQRQFAQRHPTRAHHHLLALGVRPDRQRQGIGALLLADWHEQLRPEPAAAFLLAPNTLFGLAGRAGYRILGQPITAMVTAPPLYLMWHPEPRPAPCDADPTALTSAPAPGAPVITPERHRVIEEATP